MEIIAIIFFLNIAVMSTNNLHRYFREGEGSIFALVKDLFLANGTTNTLLGISHVYIIFRPTTTFFGRCELTTNIFGSVNMRIDNCVFHLLC